ncbi:MAG: HDOD domain-containing protein [Desulfobacterales bacterium]|nr:HDOD domain-containing protein [Desulfobacterales bacterium]
MSDKILFVDDDENILDTYKRLFRKKFNVDTAKNADEALDIVEKKGPYIVIISDFRMPDMDGIQFFYYLKEIAPKSVRIMLTGFADKDTAVRAVSEGKIFRFLVKPCKPEVVEDAINSAIKYYNAIPEELDSKTIDVYQPDVIEENKSKKIDIIAEVRKSLKKDDIILPALPDMQFKFKRLIEMGSDVQIIVDLLKQDVSISSKLISLSNSSFYRGLKENKTLDKAIQRLGLTITRNCVESIGNRSLYIHSNKKYMEFMKQLWEHSISSAYAAQLISEQISYKLKNDAFTLGLFHDIGKLVLVQVISELEKKGKFKEEIKIEDILETIKLHHCEFGAVVLRKWEYVENFVKVCLYHEDLHKGLQELSGYSVNELHVVHLANNLVKRVGYGESDPLAEDLEYLESAQYLQLNRLIIEKIKEMLVEKMKEDKEYLV